MTDQPAATSGQEPPTVAAPAPTTVEQAAAILGVSVTTVKRRIRAGSLRAEQAQRPQGTVWLVYLDPAATPAAEERPPAASVVATAAATPTAQAEAMVSLIQTTIGTVLGPLVAELSASRQIQERQADRIAELERENGRLTERLVRAAPPESTLAGSGAPIVAHPSPEPLVAHWRVLAPWLLALVVLIGAGAALLWLVWPR